MKGESKLPLHTAIFDISLRREKNILYITARNIIKDYPGCRALDDVSLKMQSGKVYALIGKNGSGKSTLVKLFAGVIRPTQGELFMGSEKLDFAKPSDALDKGIVTVYQEMSLIPWLSVAENILIGRMPKKRNFINWEEAYDKASKLLETMGANIDPKRNVGDLPMWQKQIVEITKAMSFKPKVLMLDEPTSALAQDEVQNLLAFVRNLKQKDIVVIYITHKLQELQHVANEVIILRDGKCVRQADLNEINDKGIVSMMFGQVNIRRRPDDINVGDDVVLKVDGLTRKKTFSNVTFELKKGEVLGIAGMLGSGRTELLRSIFGADPVHSGNISVGNTKVMKHSPENMVKLGVGLTPEERKTEGLILIHSIKDNLCYASMKMNNKFWKIEDKKKRNRIANEQIDELQIRIPGIDAACSSLSGGNQQKVVVGNWLNTNPLIMMYDEPSRGIDVNAKQQIFEVMWAEARKGISSIFVSTELEELLEVCHRILIMHQGQLIGEVDPDKCSVEELYACCMSGNIPKSLRYSKKGTIQNE